MIHRLKRKRFLLQAAAISTGTALAGCANDIIAVGNPDASSQDSAVTADGPVGTTIDGPVGLFDSGSHFDGPVGLPPQDAGHSDGPFGVLIDSGGGPQDAGGDASITSDGPVGVGPADAGPADSWAGTVVNEGGND